MSIRRRISKSDFPRGRLKVQYSSQMGELTQILIFLPIHMDLHIFHLSKKKKNKERILAQVAQQQQQVSYFTQTLALQFLLLFLLLLRM